MQISIDSGLKTYDILDPDGNLMGTVRFNPSDPGIAARWMEAAPKIQTETEKMLKGLDSPEAALAALLESDRQIKSLIDYAFGSPVSAVFFGGQSSYGVCGDGRLVIEHVLDALQPVLAEAMQKGTEALNQRMSQHTSAYKDPTAGLAPGQTVPFPAPEDS